MSDIQSISQNNYILQAPPPSATMFTTALEYDGDKISGYAGSAFAQPSLSSLNEANVNNIIVTASLPATPDANTLYLIPEA